MTGAEGINYITVRIDDTKCKRCLECASTCPNNALEYYKGHFMHNAHNCAYCEVCMDVCPNEAITIMEM